MADSFLGEIRAIGFDWPPRLWALCLGQTMAITQNPGLFSIIGDIYGGDGRSTMGMPNLVGRVPLQAGTGPGLTPRAQGEMGGSYVTTLTVDDLPPHKHTLYTRFLLDASGYTDQPSGAWLSRRGPTAGQVWFDPPPGSGQTQFQQSFLSATGLTEGHENRQPFLAVNFIISLFGEYPARN